MSLLLFLKPIYQDTNDPGPLSGGGPRRKKKKKLTAKLVDIVKRRLPEVVARENVESRLREQEKLAGEIQRKAFERIQEELIARVRFEQEAYEMAMAQAEAEQNAMVQAEMVKAAKIAKRRKEEDEILLLLLKDIL